MASVTVSSVLGNLTNSNTVSQIMGDVNSLKALSAHAPSYVANSEFQSFVANTNTYIASIDGASGLATQTSRIDLVNTNLTATNTAIRALNTATQSALDTQEAKQASDLANTNAYIGTTQENINTQTARIDLVNTNLTATNTAIRALTTTNASDITTQTARIDLVNTNLTATNTAIRALNTATQSALDTQEAKQASDLANTNAYIGTTQGNINTQTARIDLLNTNLTSTNTAIRSTISTEVANLVDSAPGTLDTLNELAAALGDDANFSTTVTNNIATKLASANVAVYSANTNGIAQPLSSVQMSDNSVLVDPAGHLTINLGGTTYKIPYFS
jgi:hypothetical protein